MGGGTGVEKGVSESMPRKDKRKPVQVADLEADPINAALRRLHDSIASEPIPEDFLRLIDELEKKTRKP